MAELLLLLCLVFAPAVGDGAAESAGDDDEETFAFFILSLSAWYGISDLRLLLLLLKFIFYYFLLLSRDGDVC